MQFDRSRNEQQGSGLGLAIVQRLLIIYSGTLSLDSSAAGVTTVRITIPVAEL